MMAAVFLRQPGRYWARRSALLRKHHAFRSAPLTTAWRGILWMAHCALRVPGRVAIGSTRASLELPPSFAQGGIATAVYIFREEYEPEVRYFEAALSEGMTVVDGGANIGLYSVLAAEAVGPLGRVLSFEPSQAAFAALVRNTSRYPNVATFRAALADRLGRPSYITLTAPRANTHSRRRMVLQPMANRSL